MFQVLSEDSAAPLRSLQSCQALSGLHQAHASSLVHNAGARARNPTVDTGVNQCLGETLHQFQAVNKICGQEELMDKQLLLGRIGVLVCFEMFYI